jgi:Lon protease-like protein
MPIGRPYLLDESGWVANRWAELLPLPVTTKQHLLAMTDPVARLAWIHEYLQQRGALG